MRLISALETQLVAGGYMSASDESINEYYGHETVVMPVVVVNAPASTGPDWTEFGAGVAALAFGAALALAAPATAIVTIAVVVSSYWGGVIVADSFQNGANFQP